MFTHTHTHTHTHTLLRRYLQTPPIPCATCSPTPSTWYPPSDTSLASTVSPLVCASVPSSSSLLVSLPPRQGHGGERTVLSDSCPEEAQGGDSRAQRPAEGEQRGHPQTQGASREGRGGERVNRTSAVVDAAALFCCV